MLIQNARVASPRRRGGILPLVTVCLVSLVGFVALSIDVGLLLVARNNSQNAADAAALAGVRAVNGDETLNFGRDEVAPNAIRAATENPVLGGHIKGDPENYSEDGEDRFISADVEVELGSYTYFYDPNNPANDGFRLRFPRTDDTEPYGAVRANVRYDEGQYVFAPSMGFSSFGTGARAVAVHRPRDIMIVMDLSGSMRFQSLPGTGFSGSNAVPASNSIARTASLNPDPDFPRFGHYSNTQAAALLGNTPFSTSTGEFVDPCNLSVASESGPAIADYWYADSNATQKAFTKAPGGFSFTPGGDNYLRSDRNSGGNYAATVRQITNTPSLETDASFEQFGYDDSSLSAGTFQGYTQGPSYWGKTFFIWPPDPRGPTVGEISPSNYMDNGSKDWRQRFFMKVPVQPSFTGTIQRTPNTNAEYAAGYTGWMRIINLPSDRPPEPGDVVTIRNDNNRLYTVTAVRNSTLPGEGNNPSIKEINLSLPLRTRVRDNQNIEIQFRNSGWLDENTLLFDANAGFVRAAGPWEQNSSLSNTVQIGSVDYFYRINYAAIIRWLKQTGPNPFPNSLRAGRIIYYDNLPDENDVNLNARWWSREWAGISANQRRSEELWQNYIDFVLGVSWRQYRQDNNTGARFESYTRHNMNNGGRPPITAFIGNGDLYPWGAFQLTEKPTTANTGWYQTARLLSNLTAGSTTVNIGLLSAGKTPRAGDVITFWNGTWSRDYTIAADPNPTSSQITLTEPVEAAQSMWDYVVFRQIGYMNYDDNPLRFRHQYWFGPLTLMDYLGNYNTANFMWPGTVPEAQTWSCKMGIQASIEDIKRNHPNDYVGMVYYSSPRRTSGSSGLTAGQHNRSKVSMRSIAHQGHYNRLINSLWYPPKIVDGDATEIWYDDNDFSEVPRAEGGTCPEMGLMLAYNMYSSSTNLGDLRYYAKGSNPADFYHPRNGIVGGMGRQGAQKMVIFETDGAPNTASPANFVKKGNSDDNQSYFQVRIFDPDAGRSESKNEYPGQKSFSVNDTYAVAQILANRDDDPTQPGHSTARRPLLIHSVAFGTLYEPANAGADQRWALGVLQRLDYIGNTADSQEWSDFPDIKQVYGNPSQRITKMQAAFTSIMQEGVAVSLLE